MTYPECVFRRFFAIVASLSLCVLVACAGGSDAAPEAAALSEAPPTAAPTNPPPTARPTELPPSPTPLPTTTATATSEPTATAEPEPSATPTADGPDQLWLPFGFGDYGNPIVTMRNGKPAEEAAPVAIEAFFDYQPGWGILFGAQFWSAADNSTDSVTDLWLYEYASETARPLLDGNVGRAALNPIPNENHMALVAWHNGQTFDLISLNKAAEPTVLDEAIDPYFSFSPDGRRVAYLQDGRLVWRDLVSSERFETAATGLNESFGWVGDRPLWDDERDLLFFPDDPFLIIPLDGREPYVPNLLDDTPLSGTEQRPTTMLWSAELRQLVVQVDELTLDIQIYLLSEELTTVLDIYFLEGSTLMGWVEPGRSILVRDAEYQLGVWSLVEVEWVQD